MVYLLMLARMAFRFLEACKRERIWSSSVLQDIEPTAAAPGLAAVSALA